MPFCPNLLLGNSSKNRAMQTLADPVRLSCNYRGILHTHNHKLANLSKFILCKTDTRTAPGARFQGRCDLNCLSLKLSLIVLAVLLYGNGRGRLVGFRLRYGYSRKQGSERSCSLNPAESTHTEIHKNTNSYMCFCLVL